ncbi:Zn-dependent protease with chaperone function [Veronia nyctiphanis]|uniref:Zn-dependent protease with chaperone function n=1 Tax=Veronia nyctiphanis TaxID=1278244 RepID=A0A4Q0YIM5_9GAMM|nr:M48 family metallopeptidase [Veronia nyctiphanis]RXJ70550.1 Zn-dependent protease with chaperone function [Veronia nyctiphanis]
MAKGIAYKAGQSEKHPAELDVLHDGSVRLVIDYQWVESSIDQLEFNSDVGGLRVQIRFPSGELFVPDNPAELPPALKPKRSWLKRAESNLLLIVTSAAFCLLFLWLGYFYGLPAASRTIVSVLPEEVPTLLAEQVMSELDTTTFEPSALPEDKQQEITARFNDIVSQLPPMPFEPKLAFRSWELGPNAFALSDGTVVVLDSLVALSDQPEQLDSALLHELGHVYHEHVMKSVVRAGLLSVAVAVITGESSGAIDMLAGAGTLIAVSGYSRELETEADAFSAKYMLEIYGTTAPMAEMFRLLASSSESGELPEWLSSHPDIDERIQAAEDANQQ